MLAKLFLIVLLLISNYLGSAQDMRYVKSVVSDLCDPKLAGRGYVDDGVNKASSYLVKEFKKLKVKPIQGSYLQPYSFSVNTHPTAITCSIDERPLQHGADYIIDAASPSVHGNFNLLFFNWKDSIDKILLAKKIQKGFKANDALVIRYASERQTHIHDSLQSSSNPPGVIIFTEEKKLTHTIATELNQISSLTIFDSLIFNKEIITIHADHQFIADFSCGNVQGFIPGKRKDSMVVFTAHYDHLGKQGNAIFPGASDNASGVSMILTLANYYSKHKPKFNTVFILFSGEEAGLLGSDYFTTHPTINLKQIKMLVNIDIMGNAEKGITIVNGELHKSQFDLISSINAQNNYLPEVRIRGKAANSDHYHFTQKGVPAFFIYAMGGQGYYHDIFDKAEALSYTNYEQVFKLVLEFVSRL